MSILQDMVIMHMFEHNNIHVTVTVDDTLCNLLPVQIQNYLVINAVNIVTNLKAKQKYTLESKNALKRKKTH